MRRVPVFRCLCGAATCTIALALALVAWADGRAPREAHAPTPGAVATAVASSPLEQSPQEDLPPSGYDELLYGAEEPSESLPAAESDRTSQFDRFSVLEALTGEPDVRDFYHAGSGREPCCPECQACCSHCNQPWDWWVIPEGLIYRSYLAGPKESRFASVWLKEQVSGDQLQDITLGGRVGILRFGNQSAVHPEGFQLDIEGAGMPRLDLTDNRRDLNAVDFRFGVPLTYGIGRYQMKLAYYHLSSHMGDELLLRLNLGNQRINYVRDSLVWGNSYFLTPELRSYLEFAYAFYRDGKAEPWEIQFGLEYAPPCPTGPKGAPFVAANALLQQERDFGGLFTFQAGWAWRNSVGRLFRVGFQYLDGTSPQFEFFNVHEQQFGVGLWYDY